MTVTFEGKKVEVAKLESNLDGTRFISVAYFIDDDEEFPLLDDAQMDRLQEQMRQDGLIK